MDVLANTALAAGPLNGGGEEKGASSAGLAPPPPSVPPHANGSASPQPPSAFGQPPSPFQPPPPPPGFSLPTGPGGLTLPTPPGSFARSPTPQSIYPPGPINISFGSGPSPQSPGPPPPPFAHGPPHLSMPPPPPHMMMHGPMMPPGPPLPPPSMNNMAQAGPGPGTQQQMQQQQQQQQHQQEQQHPGGLSVNVNLARGPAGNAPPFSATTPGGPPHTASSATSSSKPPPKTSTTGPVLPAIGGGGKTRDEFYGEKSRALRPTLFDETYLVERQSEILEDVRKSRPATLPLRPAQYADQATFQVLRRLQERIVRAKDYRVHNTYPRRPPTLASVKGKEPAQDDDDDDDAEAAAWDLELIDDPWKEHSTMAAESRAAERQARRERQQKLRELQEKASAIPDSVLGRQQAASAAPSPAAEPSFEAELANEGSPGPETPRAAGKDGGKKAAGAGAGAGAGAALTPGGPKPITIIEQQLHTQAVNSAFRSAGSRKYGWLSGAGANGPVSVASSPLSTLKRKKKPGKDKPLVAGGEDGTPMTDRTGSAADGVSATPSKGSSNKRALSHVGDSDTPLGKRHKGEASQQEKYYAFAPIEDKILTLDYKTVLQREVQRGGPMRNLMERKLEEVMLKMAQEADADYQKEVVSRLGSLGVSKTT